MSKKNKIWDGIKVITSDGIEICESLLKLWELLGWDIENDKMASECATAVTSQLYCFGRCDLSEFTKPRKTLTLEVIPVGELNKN